MKLKVCYAKLDAVKYTKSDSRLYEFARQFTKTAQHQVMPDDHSKLVPLLPIPNRTVKRLCADDSAGSRVKVGHRQALTAQKTPVRYDWGFLLLGRHRNAPGAVGWSTLVVPQFAGFASVSYTHLRAHET